MCEFAVRQAFSETKRGQAFPAQTDRVAKPGESISPPFVRARQRQRLVEHFWLCDECAPHWTLIYDGERGITLVPLRARLPGLRLPRNAGAKLPDNFRAAFDIGMLYHPCSLHQLLPTCAGMAMPCHCLTS